MKFNKIFNLLVVAAISSVTLVSCLIDDEVYIPSDDYYADFAELQKDLLDNDTVSITITNDSIANSFTTPSGAVLTFPDSAFFAAGHGVSGVTGNALPLTVKFIPIYYKKDFIANYYLTSTVNGESLISGGAYYLSVTDANGGTLNPHDVAVQFPTALTETGDFEDSIKLATSTSFSVPSGSVVGWTIPATVTSPVDTNTNNYFTVNKSPMGWSGLMANWHDNVSDYTQFSVQFTNVEDLSKTKVFFVSDDSTVVLELYSQNTAGLLSTQAEAVPVNTVGKLLAISIEKGMLRASVRTATISGNNIFPMAVYETDIDGLNSLLLSVN